MVGGGTSGRCGEVSGETCARGDACRSQSLHGTVRLNRRVKARREETCAQQSRGANPAYHSHRQSEKRGEQTRAEGREAGRWKREIWKEAKRERSDDSAREGYTRRTDPAPRLALGRSRNLDGTHVGGAGERRQRRQMVRFAGQMLSSLNRGSSPLPEPTSWRANHDVETTDWRAVCGRTARTVRRAGRARALSDPYRRLFQQPARMTIFVQDCLP